MRLIALSLFAAIGTYAQAADPVRMIPIHGTGGTFSVGRDGQAYFDKRLWNLKKSGGNGHQYLYEGTDPDGGKREVELRRQTNGKPYAVVVMPPEYPKKEMAIDKLNNMLESLHEKMGFQLGSGISRFDGIEITSIGNDKDPEAASYCYKERDLPDVTCLSITPKLCQALLESTDAKSMGDFLRKRMQCQVLATRWNQNVKKPQVQEEMQKILDKHKGLLNDSLAVKNPKGMGTPSQHRHLRPMDLTLDDSNRTSGIEQAIAFRCMHLFERPGSSLEKIRKLNLNTDRFKTEPALDKRSGPTQSGN